jgi:hypothetical protein
VGLAVALVTFALPVDAGDGMTMAVSPLRSFSPSNLKVQVRVQPSADNRLLEVVADSPEFYSSSQIQMDGARAPKTFIVEFRDVPSGDYEVTGVLMNEGGDQRAVARQKAVVLPSGQDR